MSYVKGNVIYGVPWTEEMRSLLGEILNTGEQHPLYAECLEFSHEHEILFGFEFFYHGSLPYEPGYCGVVLGQFNECSDLPVSYLTGLAATTEQKAKAEKMLADLPVEIRAKCQKIGTWIVWSTS